MWSRWKLRTKLLALILGLLLLTVTGLSTMALMGSGNALRSQMLSNMEQIALKCAELLQARVQVRIEALRISANADALRSMDWERQKPALEAAMAKNGYLAMAVVGRDHQAHYADGSTADLSKRGYVEKAFEGEANISNVIISRVTNSAVLMIAAPLYDLEKPTQVNAVLIARIPATLLSDITDSIQFIQGSYAYAIDDRGVLVAHANRDYVLDQRNFIEESKNKPDLELLAGMFRRMIAREVGNDQYYFQGHNRMFAFAPVPNTPWSIALGALTEEVLASLGVMRRVILSGAAVVMLLGTMLTLFIAQIMVKPIRKTTDMLRDIAQGEGDLTQRLVVQSNDEIGEMAGWFNTFITKVQGIISEMGKNTLVLSASSEELSATAVQIAGNAEEMGSQANTVASATEQSTTNLNNISAAAEEISTSISTVASAIEELSTSMRDVEGNCRRESEVAESADKQARSAKEIMERLGVAANKIGSVVAVINQIAGQTNLLALNATIEAASAGEAGKGFAVVAGEVKELARQTAQATQEIRTQIENMQGNATAAVQAIEKITEVVIEINRISQTIVHTVSEQSTTVSEIANSVSGVNAGARDVARNVAESAQGLNEVARNIAGVNQAAGDTAKGITQVKTSAVELAQLASGLEAIVRQFKV